MLTWIANIMLIAVFGFVGYVICLAVDRKIMSQMILLVAVMMGLLTTIEDLTPTFRSISSQAQGFVGAVDRLTSIGQGRMEWPANGEITQGFNGSDHHGIDIALAEGSTVRSAGKGIIEKVAQDDAYGLYVIVKHDSGEQSLYAHLSRVTRREGWPVATGVKIAESGSTGNSNGPHLHFEIRLNGIAVDPFPYLN